MPTSKTFLLLAISAALASGQIQTLTYFQLPGLTVKQNAQACFMNESGTVAANSTIYTDPVRFQPYLLKNDGEFEVLEDFPGYPASSARGINGRGDVVGYGSAQGQFNRIPLLWKDRIPMQIIIPPPQNPANRWWATPRDIDNAGRVLLNMAQINESGQLVSPQLYYVLEGNTLTELPPFPVGGGITSVSSSHYLAMDNSGRIAGSALVVLNGTLRVIGFIYRDGNFTTVLVDDLFRVLGFSQQGEVFGQLFDEGFFVWKDGQTRILPDLIADEQVLSIDGWNNKNQTCAAVNVHTVEPGAWKKHAIITFGLPGGGAEKP
jgi:hypothetical protein